MMKHTLSSLLTQESYEHSFVPSFIGLFNKYLFGVRPPSEYRVRAKTNLAAALQTLQLRKESDITCYHWPLKFSAGVSRDTSSFQTLPCSLVTLGLHLFIDSLIHLLICSVSMCHWWAGLFGFHRKKKSIHQQTVAGEIGTVLGQGNKYLIHGVKKDLPEEEPFKLRSEECVGISQVKRIRRMFYQKRQDVRNPGSESRCDEARKTKMSAAKLE